MSNTEFLDVVRRAAVQELAQEEFRARVEQEKARIRAQRNKSLWQRLISKLPFQTRSKP